MEQRPLRCYSQVNPFFRMNQISALSALLTPKRCNRPELLRMTSLALFDPVWVIIPDSSGILDYPGLSQNRPILSKCAQNVDFAHLRHFAFIWPILKIVPYFHF